MWTLRWPLHWSRRMDCQRLYGTRLGDLAKAEAGWGRRVMLHRPWELWGGQISKQRVALALWEHSKLQEATHFPSTDMKPLRKGYPGATGWCPEAGCYTSLLGEPEARAISSQWSTEPDTTERRETWGRRDFPETEHFCLKVFDSCWYMEKPIQYCKVKKKKKSLSYLKRVSNWDKSKTLNCFGYSVNILFSC